MEKQTQIKMKEVRCPDCWAKIEIPENRFAIYCPECKFAGGSVGE